MPKDIPSQVISEMDATQKRPVLLFELGLSSTLRFAAYKTNVVFPTAGNTYGAKTVKIGEAKQTLEGQIGRVTVKFDNVLKDMAGYLAIEDFKGKTLIIKRVYLDALGSATYYNEVFNGYVEEVKGIDRHWLEVKATTGKPLSHKALSFAYQRMCPWIFGGVECNTDGNANLASLNASGTADSGTSITLVDNALTQANDYWNFGEIEVTKAGKTYYRKVANFASSTDTITFDVELPFAVDGSCTYTVYKGCDQVWETCESTPAYGPSADNSDNFGGCIHFGQTFRKPKVSSWDDFIEWTKWNDLEQPDNTSMEGIFVARAYGRVRMGGNKVRYSSAYSENMKIIIGHCRGPVEGIVDLYANEVHWDDVKGSISKTEYPGDRTQTADGRFSSRASAYRGIAYTALSVNPTKKAMGADPIITCVMEALKCPPLAGGADAYTRNPAVVLYDFYLNVEGYSAGEIDVLSFQSLEELCDAVPSGGTLPRYTFDYNFTQNRTINDAKKMIWQAFNGKVVMSQGKLRVVWDSAQMADGAGSLETKTVSHAFTEDNIVKDSISWKQQESPNLVRVHYQDSGKFYNESSVEVKDDRSILENGEILYKEDAYFLTETEPVRRRAQYLFNKFKYEKYEVKLKAFSGAGDLEVYDLVTVTHQLTGWTSKQFYVKEKSEDQNGLLKFTLKEYYSGIHDDSEAGDQAGYGTTLPNPYDDPADSTSITATLVTTGTTHNYDAVRISFTPPADDPFYLKTEIYASNDDSTYYLVGESSGEDFILNGMGSVYQPGETCYIKLVNINDVGVAADMPVTYDASVVISGSIRFGSFYVGPYDMWGGNAAIGNAATKIVMGNLDGTPKIALGVSADAITFAGTQTGFFVDGNGNLRAGGTQSLKWNPSTSRLTIGEWIISPNGIADNFTENDATIFIDKTNALMRLGATSGDYLTLDGGNLRIRSSNYVSGIAGAGFTLEPDLLEVGNIAARGIIRTAVFQADVVSAVGGNLMVRPADVLDTDMTVLDASTLTIEGNESFAVNDILRIKTGLDDEWLLVTNIASAPTYTVTRDQAGVYGADSNPAWEAGATVVNYGQSGDGGVYLTASESNAPYMSIFTHAGAPWTTITTHLRVGNLNGFLDYSSDLYGIAIGETNAYLKYDPTNGLRIKGDISVESMAGLPADDNLAAYWSLDEGDGVVAIDNSGNAKDLTLYNTPTWIDGVSGKCLEFNGSTQYAGTASIFSSPQTALSISCWVYVDNFNQPTGVARRTPFVSDWNTWDVGFQKGFSFSASHSTSNTTQWAFVICDGTDYITAASTLIADATFQSTYAGKWLHLVATYEASTAMKIYVDGVEVASNTSSIPASMTPETATQTWLGRTGVNAGYLDGKPDEVRVYTAVLTESEVKALSLSPAGNSGGSIYVATSIGIGSTTWQSDGIQLQYNAGNPRFYCGDGANEYFQFDGTGMTISTAQSSAITIKSGGDIDIEYGGDINFVGSSYTITFNANTIGNYIYLAPDIAGATTFEIGTSALPMSSVAINTENWIDLQASPDGNTAARVLLGTSPLPKADLSCMESGNTVYIRLEHEYLDHTHFAPSTDSLVELGITDYRWANVWTDLINGGLPCRIKIGTYTGDGTEGQAITGVDFPPLVVHIYPHPSGSGSSRMYEKIDMVWGDTCWENTDTGGGGNEFVNGRINSLDSDGFTVDDQGSNGNPNALDVVYDYWALG